jgi:hypothetical protein
MSKIVAQGRDSVQIGLASGQIELRIGEEAGNEGRGSRFIFLSPKEARKIAIVLLQEAERTEENNTKSAQ